MTPRYDWQWDTNFLAAAAIRFHCWRNCACAEPDKEPGREDLSKKIWQFVQNGKLFATRENGVKMGPVAGGKRLRSGREILPPQKRFPGGGSSAGTCGRDGRQFCVERWPSSLLGPIPTAPPDPKNLDGVVVEDPDADVGQCVNHCTGQYDCNAGDGIDACDCTVLDPAAAKLYGVDPVTPPNLCLLVLQASATKGLHGRGLVEDRVCRCNVTYISPGCCGSRDGMV